MSIPPSLNVSANEKRWEPEMLLSVAWQRKWVVLLFTVVGVSAGVAAQDVITIAADQLGTRNTLVAAVVFASLMVPSAIGAPLSGRLSPAAAQRIGMGAFFVGVCALLVLLVRVIGGAPLPRWTYAAPPLVGALLWPLLSVLLQRPQRPRRRDDS